MRPTSPCACRSVLGLAMLASVATACGTGDLPSTGSGGASGGAGQGGSTGGSQQPGTGGSADEAGAVGTSAAGAGGHAGSAGSANASGGQAGKTAAGGGGTGGSSGGNAGGGGGGGRGAAGASGGAGSSGGAGNAGSAGIGGPSLCASSKFLVCEDFESTAVAGIPTGWTKHGDATVQADQAARGSHALKMGAIASGERRIYADATKLGSSHWGRIYYKVQMPAAKPSSGVIHSTMVGFQGKGPMNGDSEYRVVDTVEDSNGKHQFLWNVQPSSVNEFGKGSPYNWTYDDKWHCAEWHVDAAVQSYHFYIDDKEVTEIAINNGAGNYNGTDIPNAFSQVRIGWYNYQSASPGFVAWLDELALDANRIGCGN